MKCAEYKKTNCADKLTEGTYHRLTASDVIGADRKCSEWRCCSVEMQLDIAILPNDIREVRTWNPHLKALHLQMLTTVEMYLSPLRLITQQTSSLQSFPM